MVQSAVALGPDSPSPKGSPAAFEADSPGDCGAGAWMGVPARSTTTGEKLAAHRRGISIVRVVSSLCAFAMSWGVGDVVSHGAWGRGEASWMVTTAHAQPRQAVTPEDGMRLPQRHLALGPDVGVVGRVANRDGVTYGAGFSYGAHLDVPIVRWLSLALYYLHASHSVSVDGSVAFGTSEALSLNDSVSSYVLGARIQPSWALGERGRIWVSAGATWGILNFPVVTIAAPEPYPMATPHHAFVEIPLGLGGEWEVIPNWLTVQVNALYGKSLTEGAPPRVQSITQAGHAVYTQGFGGFSHSLTAVLGAMLIL